MKFVQLEMVELFIDNSYAVIKKNEIWIMNLFIDLKELKNKF